MTAIIAIDSSSHVGCAIGAIGSAPKLTSIAMSDGAGDRHEDIYGRAARWITNKISACHPVVMAIETPPYMVGKSNHNTTQVLIGVYAIMTGIARASNITVWQVSVSTWRKHTLGTSKFGGRAEAKRAMMKLCQQLGWSAPDDNAADSAGIWIWAAAKYAPWGAVAVEPLLIASGGAHA